MLLLGSVIGIFYLLEQTSAAAVIIRSNYFERRKSHLRDTVSSVNVRSPSIPEMKRKSFFFLDS